MSVASIMESVRLLFGRLFQAPSWFGEQTGYCVAVLDNRQKKKRGRAVGTGIGQAFEEGFEF